jgi:hypothetical protein
LEEAFNTAQKDFVAGTMVLSEKIKQEQEDNAILKRQLEEMNDFSSII